MKPDDLDLSTISSTYKVEREPRTSGFLLIFINYLSCVSDGCDGTGSAWAAAEAQRSVVLLLPEAELIVCGMEEDLLWLEFLSVASFCMIKLQPRTKFKFLKNK